MARNTRCNGSVPMSALVMVVMIIMTLSSNINTVHAWGDPTNMAFVAEDAPVRPHDPTFFLPYTCVEAGICCPTTNDMPCGGDGRGTCFNITTDVNSTMCEVTNDPITMVNGVHSGAGLFWVTDYFEFVCKCEGHYDGIACEKCALGWSGQFCNISVDPIVRRDFASLSDIDKQYVIDGFRLLKVTPHPYQPNVTMFDWIAILHEWSLRDIWPTDLAKHPELAFLVAYGHSGAGAVTWHRRITNEMEHLLQLALGNDSFAIPYWNFSGSAGSDADPTLYWFGGDGDPFGRADYQGDEFKSEDQPSCRIPDAGSSVVGCWCPVTRGPFQRWPLLSLWGYPEIPSSIGHAFGCASATGPSVPSQTFVNWLTNNETAFGYFLNGLGGGYLIDWPWGSWPHCIEGVICDLHLRAHRYIGGTMVGSNPGADPLFYLLHGHADLIFERWIRQQMLAGLFDISNIAENSAHAIGQDFLECQAPFYPLMSHRTQFVPSYTLGFTYDLFKGVEGPWDEPFEPPSDARQFDSSLLDGQTAFSLESAPANSTMFFAPYSCYADLIHNGTTSCCPLYNGNVCGGIDRGVCTSITDANLCDVNSKADALWWLTDHFDSVCVCKSGYSGTSCGECADGYTGDDCTQTVVNIRKDFRALSREEKQRVIDAFTLAKLVPSSIQPSISVFDYMASMYYWSLPGKPSIDIERHPALADGVNYNGDGTHLLWVRRFIRLMERELQRILNDTAFSLPYWNWTDSLATGDNDEVLRWFGNDGDMKSELPEVCRFSDDDGFGGGECRVVRGQYSYWPRVQLWGATTTSTNTAQTESTNSTEEICRCFACAGRIAASLPSPSVVNGIMTLTKWDNGLNSSEASFVQAMAGYTFSEEIPSDWPPSIIAQSEMISRVSNWLGGSMRPSSVYAATSAASDPLYFLHLTFIDLLTDRWYTRHADDVISSTTVSQLLLDDITTGQSSGTCISPMLPLMTNDQLFTDTLTHGYRYQYNNN